MSDVVLVLGVLAIFVGGPIVLVRSSLHRRNRISRRAPVPPAHWLVMPDRAARLHRRLVRVCRVAGPARGRSSHTAQLLEAEAIAIDRRLLVAAGVPPARRRELLAELESRVERLEDVVLRMGRVEDPSMRELGAPSRDALAELEDRLSALDQGWAEVDRVDRTSPTPPPAS